MAHREERTIEAMIELYCHDIHNTKSGLCPECSKLLEYVRSRLDKCPFKENKPVCAKCPVHCYQPNMREQIKTVMRYSGPRMAFGHPILALFHIIDNRRKTPIKHQSG